ncbi:MAG: hypothetical protein ABWU13_22390 [Limnospira maxima]|uniref:Uncharacterized protein n=1 Tax=Limnospira indica PCC 8005 TaxID=376219 RepID=A0A9P1KC05_9CYAN|nr:hypothetical protein [Limnospira indica]CDM93257.1 conserved hypothetical protein [Limnospira indica PCC 8005]
MEKTNIKEEAKRLIDELPDNSTWDDLMYSIYVRQMVEAGIADSENGKVTAVEDVRKKFSFPSVGCNAASRSRFP